MNKKILNEVKQEVEMLQKNWNIFIGLKTLDEIEVFLNSSDIGEIINFVEIKNIFEENNINFNFKKVKAYLQDFFIVNTYNQIMKKLFVVNKEKLETEENNKLFNESVFIKKIIKLYLFDEGKSCDEVLYKTKDDSVSVDAYIDKVAKDFMLNCFLFVKTFVK